MRTFHKYSLSCSGRRSSRGSSHQLLSKSNSTTVTMLKAVQKCDLCGVQLHQMMDDHFEKKYNQSKRFYYARDIDDLLMNHHTPTTILTKDILQVHQSEEYLKRYRPKEEFTERLKNSCEYFKYYKDLPRYTMEEEGSLIRKHYESNRILEYNKLKHVLKLEEDIYSTSRRKSQRRTKVLQESEGSGRILKEIISTTDIQTQKSPLNNSLRNQQEESLEGLRLQLSQLIANIDLGGKHKEPTRKTTNLRQSAKRRSSMPDCSQISSIKGGNTKNTKKATRSQESRNFPMNNWMVKNNKENQKIGGRQLKTTTSPLKFSRTIKNSRNLRSECSQEKSRLRTYKRSIQTLESNYQSNKLSSTKMSPHNISHLAYPHKELKSPSARRSTIKNPPQTKANITHTRIPSDQSDPFFRKLEIYCPKNPIQIAISNNNCISIYLQQKKSQGVNPFKKKIMR